MKTLVIILMFAVLMGCAVVFWGIIMNQPDMKQLDIMIQQQGADCAAKGGTLITGSTVVIPLPPDYKFPCVKAL
jgi:hypothetical protein